MSSRSSSTGARSIRRVRCRYTSSSPSRLRARSRRATSPGTRLDNEIGLARRLSISHPTVRRAIEHAVRQGLLFRRRGVGTLVTPIRVSRAIRLTSLYNDLETAGQRPATKVLTPKQVAAPPEVTESLGLDVGAAVTRLERLRFATDQPISFMTNFHPLDVLEVARKDLEATGLYRILRSRGIIPRVASQVIGAASARGGEACLLEVAVGAPLSRCSARPMRYPAGRLSSRPTSIRPAAIASN